MDIGESIGLRIRVAARITVGVIISSVGSIFTSIGGSTVGGEAFFAGIVMWTISLFVGLVVAL